MPDLGDGLLFTDGGGKFRVWLKKLEVYPGSADYRERIREGSHDQVQTGKESKGGWWVGRKWNNQVQDWG
jgi:hypothetical protein